MNEQQKKKRILVVDNDPDNTLVVRIALEDNGFEVDAFNDPTEARRTTTTWELNATHESS